MHISITHSFQTDFVIFQFSHTFILPTFSFHSSLFVELWAFLTECPTLWKWQIFELFFQFFILLSKSQNLIDLWRFQTAFYVLISIFFSILFKLLKQIHSKTLELFSKKSFSCETKLIISDLFMFQLAKKKLSILQKNKLKW